MILLPNDSPQRQLSSEPTRGRLDDIARKIDVLDRPSPKTGSPKVPLLQSSASLHHGHDLLRYSRYR